MMPVNKFKSCIHRKLSGDATKIEILLAEPPEGVVGGAVCHHRAEERHSPGARGAEDTNFVTTFIGNPPKIPELSARWPRWSMIFVVRSIADWLIDIILMNCCCIFLHFESPSWSHNKYNIAIYTSRKVEGTTPKKVAFSTAFFLNQPIG